MRFGSRSRRLNGHFGRDVDVIVILPVIVAALLNGNETVDVIDTVDD